MSSLVDIAAGFVADLNAAGVRATMDTRNIAPPTVLVSPPSIVLDTNCGGTATWEAFIIVPPPANADAWRKADEIAAMAAAVIPIGSMNPTSYGADDGGALPAFRITWTTVTDWP